MRKFTFKTSIFSFFILVFLISVNYWGDAAHLFNTSYEKQIAKMIFDNYHVTNISNLDERILQKNLIEKMQQAPDVLVLGSSRTMLINSTFFNNEKFINSSVSGAGLEDVIAIFQIYKQRNILPKKIILGVDAWLFNREDNKRRERWIPLKEFYYQYWGTEEFLKKEYPDYKMKQLFSFSYFQVSLKNLSNVILDRNVPIRSEKIYNKASTILFDGSHSYSKEYREASNEEIDHKAQMYIVGKIYGLENYREIDTRLWTEFKYLCQDIIDNNIELSFFISPYHFFAYEKIEKNYPIVLQVEKKIKEFADENNIKYWGSFNPQELGIDNSGFYDGMHCKENTVKKILKVRTQNNTYKSLGEW